MQIRRRSPVRVTVPPPEGAPNRLVPSTRAAGRSVAAESGVGCPDSGGQLADLAQSDGGSVVYDQVAITADPELQSVRPSRAALRDRAGLDHVQVGHQHHGCGANAKTNRQGAGLLDEHGHDRPETDCHHDLE